MTSRQGSNSIFSGLKKLTSRNDDDSTYSQKRQPSVSSNNHSIQHSSSFHSIDSKQSKSNLQSPPSPGHRASNFTLTYKDINALTDMKPIPTVKSHHSSSSYQSSKKVNSVWSTSNATNNSNLSISHSSHAGLSSATSISSAASHSRRPSHNVSSNATDFQMRMPEDPAVIDAKFTELMEKRDFKSLPQTAKNEMHNYSSAKKWMLIYQDALGEFKKQERRTKQGEESVTPEFYVKKLVDKTITIQQLGDLWVSLRTESVSWVNRFIEAQGLHVLCNVLQQLHTKTRHSAMSAEELLDREHHVIRCLKAILNITEGADMAVHTKSCIPALAGVLLSPRLGTRKLVTEMLVFLAHWLEPEGYKQVLRAIDALLPDNVYTQTKGMERYQKKRDTATTAATARSKPRRFEEWFRVISETLDGRGKMGSLVGASEEYKASGPNGETQLAEYIHTSLLLINSIAQGGEDFRIRTHIRAQFRAAGLGRLFKKFQELGSDQIDEKMREFEENAAVDYELLVKADRVGANVDLNDPVSLIGLVWHKLKGTDAEGYFLSTVQHMFLTQADPMKSSDSQELSRLFRLIDGIVSGVSMHNTSSDGDAAVQIAMQRLYAGLQTDATARRAVQELKEATKRAEEATAERDELARQISLGANGMLEKLAKELKEQEIVLVRQRRMNEQLSAELDDLKKQHLAEKQQQELEMRELFVAISNADLRAEVRADSGVLATIQQKLLEKKDGYRKQSTTWNKTVEPNARLRSLRDQMEDLGRQARELEMTDFENRLRPTTAFKSPVPYAEPPRPAKDDDLDKLARLRKKLESLQQDSNDIIKYSDDERFRELMVQKKYMAVDRLHELNTSFQDFNIDFNIEDIPETAEKRSSVGPAYKNKLKAELSEIQALKAELQKRLDALDDRGAAMRRLESKYIGGKVGKEEQPDIGNGEKPDIGNGDQPGGPLSPGSAPPPPPPLPAMFGGVAAEQANPAVPANTAVPIAGDKSPPPPPPPPLPGMLSPMSPPFSPDSPVPPPLPSAMPKSAVSIDTVIADPFGNYPRPKRKLKQLHWEKLENTENSVWDGVSGETFANDLMDKGVFEEMEEMFAAKEAKKLGGKKASEGHKVTFLARDVSQQFGINLHGLSSLSEEQTVKIILECDPMVLENSNVMEFLGKREMLEIPTTLARNLEPYSTDWTRGSEKKPDKDPTELQRADRIYLELMYNLQHYWGLRMRALLVMTSFEKEYSILVGKLQQIDDAVEAIQNSDNIRYVFNVILAFGNYMNDAGKQARGFRLGTLQRLSFMKDDKNSMTFLHYIEKIIRQVYPQFAEFLEELRPVLAVSKLSVEVVENDCKEYCRAIKNVEDSVDIGNLSDSTKFHPKDRVLAVILPLLPDARRKSDLLSEQAKIILNGFNRLMSFFGENTSDNFARNAFFAKFANFISEYQKAQKDNIAREEELRVYEQRKLLLLQTTEKKQDTKDGNAVMDNLLEKLKQVGPSKGDPSSARRKALARKKLLEAKKNILDVTTSGLGISPDDSTDDTSYFTDNSIREEPAVDSKDSDANDSLILDEDDEIENSDVGARARNLLKSLRGSSSPNTNGEGLSAAQQLRIQRRLERQKEREKPVDTTEDDASSSNSQ